jgi:hypothetical protein
VDGNKVQSGNPLPRKRTKEVKKQLQKIKKKKVNKKGRIYGKVI